MRRYVCAALIILVFASLFSGCRKGDASNEGVEGQDLAGFSLSGAAEGGGTVHNANLFSLAVEERGGDTALTLDFVSDSKLSGEGTQAEVGNPPKYKVYLLDKPYRLVVEFGALAYWDYERTFDPGASALIQGVFNYSPEQGGVFRLYVQLAKKTAYRVDAEDSAVTVTLRPVVEAEAAPSATPGEGGAVDILESELAPAGAAYYVLANAYRGYCSGTIDVPEMTPVLCANGANILLISKAFNAKDKVEALMDAILKREENAVPANWGVVLLEDGLLPDYTQEMDYLAAYDVAPARVDGAPAKLDVAIPDGLFLTLTPDRRALLYSKRVVEYEAGGGVTEYELLYIGAPGGESRKLLDFEFQSVESARYSPDGRKLAVLERSGESAHLYVFDVDSRDLVTDLSAVGFGDTVSAYCWDSMGGRIFSIGGSNEIVVHQYDFNVPNESKRHTVVDKKGVDETSLNFLSGEVYFCETTLEKGAEMFRIKPEGGLRRFYLAADAFCFSKDSRYLAFTLNGNDFFGAAASGAQPVFAVRDLQTGEVTNIQSGFRVFTFLWSEDAKKLFYFENMLSGDLGEGGDGDSSAPASGNDPYPYRLWVYDMQTGKSRALADLTTTNIGVSAAGDAVYVCYVDAETLGEVVRATYALKLQEE